MQGLSIAVNGPLVFAEAVVDHAEGLPGLGLALTVADVIDLGEGLSAEGSQVASGSRGGGGRRVGGWAGTAHPESVEAPPEVAQCLGAAALAVEHPGQVLVGVGLRPGISHGAVKIDGVPVVLG